MTADENTTGSGEERLKVRRHRFIRYFVIAIALSALAGLLSGALSKFYEAGDVPLWVPVLACLTVVVGLVWATWDYFRRIDELDLMDNLWAHTIGLYGGIIAFGVWFFLADLGVAETPNALAIVAVALIVTFAAYGLRKLGLR
ncbi:hypothetical protein [Alteriqipengyuania sp. 357]